MTGDRPSGILAVLLAALLLAGCLAGETCLAQTGKLSLVTGALPPYSSVPGRPGFLEQLARAAFRRIGVEVEVTTVPVERAMINVNAGIDDGDLFRVAGVERVYPNLLRVPEKLFDSEFIAYTKRADIRIRDWADLQPYIVAYANGWVIFDRNVKTAKEITKTPSLDDLYPLLDKGRADVILMDRWQWRWVAREKGYGTGLYEAPLAKVEIFMYLHKKHADLVPKVARALADMKADGSYQKIYDAYLKPLDTR
jgi:polar amino acid transport system substrate-binding protein